MKFFKRTRNFCKDVVISVMVWMLTNIWTSPWFISIVKCISCVIPIDKYVYMFFDWVNRYVEDNLMQLNKVKRTALVVEVDDAVGYSLCKKLVKKRYHVIIGVRDVGRGLSIKSRLLRIHPYATVTIIAIDMSNPMNVLYAAKRILQKFSSLDVLYLNNSSIKIDHLNWSVVKEGFTSFRLGHLLTTGRVYEDGPNFVTIRSQGKNELGFSKDFCEHVLSPFILVMELKDILKEADLPGRVVWTGSTTCSSASFSFDNPQHISENDSFYAHKYFVHLIQPALNDYLSHSKVQSFEGSPGIIITGTSPKTLRNWTWLLYIIGFFIPTVQIYASSGARTLLLLGTHRNQYKYLDPNHMYEIRRSIFGLRPCHYVKDIEIGESRRALAWLFDLYKKLKRSDMLMEGVTENVMMYSEENEVYRQHRNSVC